jgi:hypothetical protein
LATPIAEAYAVDGKTQFTIKTTPGRMISFRGAHATIWQGSDMKYILRTPGLVIEVHPEHVDWISGWMTDCGEPKATVNLPKGYSFGPAPDYKLHCPQPGKTGKGRKSDQKVTSRGTNRSTANPQGWVRDEGSDPLSGDFAGD